MTERIHLHSHRPSRRLFLLSALLSCAFLCTACDRGASSQTAAPATQGNAHSADANGSDVRSVDAAVDAAADATAGAAPDTQGDVPPWQTLPEGTPAEEIIGAWLETVSRPLDEAMLTEVARMAAPHRAVLLGESTHGTREYYALRAAISLDLVREHGFRIVAVEGDWEAIARLNRRVQDEDERDALAILQTFERWPRWMWANREMAEFVEALRAWNLQRPPQERVHLYGVDIYGAVDSVARLAELEEVEPDALWPCLAPRIGDRQAYLQAYAQGAVDCSAEATEVARRMEERLREADPATHADLERAMSAAVVAAAEGHYRAMVQGGPASWNSRAAFFAEALAALLAFHGEQSRAVFWAHNTHVGDAAATPMGSRGETNIGRRMRELLPPEEVWGLGFGTFEGEVLAGARWGAPMERMTMPPAPAGTWEALMAEVPHERFFLPLNAEHAPPQANAVRGHRAVGVMYHPPRDRGNYVPSRLVDRYDAFVFVRRTHPLHPLHED